MATAIELYKLYEDVFGKKPVIDGLPKNDAPRGTIRYSSKQIAFNKIGLYGQDIWHPVTLSTVYNGQNISIEIEACTIAVNLAKTVIKTAVSERKGTVKEVFNIEDYKFTVRGFVIGKNRKFPEDEITKLKQIFESGNAVEMHGGYPEIFLDGTCHVVVSSLEFPEVQGKAHWIRPFSLTADSDFIDTLILK